MKGYVTKEEVVETDKYVNVTIINSDHALSDKARTITFMLPDKATISEVKDRIYKDARILVVRQMLTLDNKIPAGKDTLRVLGLKDTDGTSRFDLMDYSTLQPKGIPQDGFKIKKAYERSITLNEIQHLADFVQRRQGKDGIMSGWGDFGPPSHRRKTPKPITFPAVTVNHVVEWVVSPATAQADCSYVEFVSKSSEPREPQWFISHYSSQPISALMKCIENHAKVRTTPSQISFLTFWMSALSQKPSEVDEFLKSNLEHAPFLLALRRCWGLLLVVDPASECFSRTWCLFEHFCGFADRGRTDPLRVVLDLASIGSDGEAHVVTDGLTEQDLKLEISEAWKQKSEREEGFPTELVLKGLELDFAESLALSPKEKKWIMQALMEPPLNFNNEDDDSTPAAIAKECRYVTASLKGMFAAAILRESMRRDSDEVESVANALQGDILREHLTLALDGIDGDRIDDHVKTLGSHFSQNLVSMYVDVSNCEELTNAGVGGLGATMPRRLKDLSIDLKGCPNIDDVGLSELFTSFQRIEHLDKLYINLSHCNMVGDRTLRLLGPRIPQGLRDLQLICTGCVNIKDKGLEGFVRALPTKLGNIGLDLEGTGVSEEQLKLAESTEKIMKWKQRITPKTSPRETPHGVLPGAPIEAWPIEEDEDEGLLLESTLAKKTTRRKKVPVDETEQQKEERLKLEAEERIKKSKEDQETRRQAVLADRRKAKEADWKMAEMQELRKLEEKERMALAARGRREAGIDKHKKPMVSTILRSASCGSTPTGSVRDFRGTFSPAPTQHQHAFNLEASEDGEESVYGLVGFLHWVDGRWELFHDLFRSHDKTARFHSCREVCAREFSEFVWSKGFEGNALQVFREIETETVGHKNPSSGGITLAQLIRFERRGQIFAALGEGSPVFRFASFLRQRHNGSVLRAWRNDIDLRGTGRVAYKDFELACKNMKQHGEARAIWKCVRPDFNMAPLEFRDIDPEEAENVELFCHLIRTIFPMDNHGLDLDSLWVHLDPGNRGFTLVVDFISAVKDMGFEGDARLLYRGLELSAEGRLTKDEIQYLMVLRRSAFATERAKLAARRKGKARSGTPTARGAERTFSNWTGAWSIEKKKRFRAVSTSLLLETRWENSAQNYSHANNHSSKYEKRYFVDYFERPVRADLHKKLQEKHERKEAEEIEKAHAHLNAGEKGNFHAFNAAPVSNLYRLLGVYLGHGKYGGIVKAEHLESHEFVAVKTLAKNRVFSLDAITIEAVLMQRLDHPNIANLIDTFQDFRNVYLVLELCMGTDLLEAITERKGQALKETFGEHIIAPIIQQLFAGVSYMHSRQIVHRDICPENLMFLDHGVLTGNVLKIIGFGAASKCEEGEHMKTKLGSPLFVSPQMIMGWYSLDVDVWACGVIMYLLLAGFPPFKGDSDPEVLSRIFRAEFKMNELPEFWIVSPAAKQLTAWCLMKDPERRCSAEQAHEHDWCKGQSAPPKEGPKDGGAALVKRLRDFRLRAKGQKATPSMDAVKEVEESHIRRLHEIFSYMDAQCGGHGTLDINDLNAALAEEGFHETLPEFQKVMQDSAKHNVYGLVNYNELLGQIVDKKLHMMEELSWETFRDHDPHHIGRIPVTEVLDLLSQPERVGCSLEVAEIVARRLERKNSRKVGDKGDVVSFVELFDLMKSATLQEVGFVPDMLSPKPRTPRRRKQAPSDSPGPPEMSPEERRKLARAQRELEREKMMAPRRLQMKRDEQMKEELHATPGFGKMFFHYKFGQVHESHMHEDEEWRSGSEPDSEEETEEDKKKKKKSKKSKKSREGSEEDVSDGNGEKKDKKSKKDKKEKKDKKDKKDKSDLGSSIGLPEGEVY